MENFAPFATNFGGSFTENLPEVSHAVGGYYTSAEPLDWMNKKD
jgi:hypothetical protein